MKTGVKLIVIALIACGGAFTLTNIASAQSTDYKLLAPIPLNGPGSGPVDTVNTSTYLPGLIKLIIALAGAFAVVKIILAGIQYMSTDAWSGKNEAKGSILNALFGLLLAMSAWLILYTINPKLVNLSLAIPEQEIATTTLEGPGVVVPEIDGVPITNPTPTAPGGVGCQGECRYSYTNGAGILVRYKDCSSCSDATRFGLDIKTRNINGTAAQMNTELGNKLKAVNQALDTGFRITETWPPTVNHAAQEQYDGTSVDVSLSTNTGREVDNFIKSAQSQGLRVVYEVQSPADANIYTSQGIPACTTRPHSGCVLPVNYVTGPHFSVYLR